MNLNEIPLSDALGVRPLRIVTMSCGQWDTALAALYDAGWVLLELDEDEQPRRAFRKAPTP